MQKQTFDPELLKKSDKEKSEYFRSKRIMHTLLKQAMDELLEAIRFAGPRRLIFTYGPAGVGKSTLGNIVCEQIIRARLEQLMEDLESIPAAQAEMPPPPSGTFSWAEALRSMLMALGEPLIDFKMAPRKKIEGIDIPGYDRSNTRRYLHAYEKAMSHRRPEIMLLDDAHYLGKVPTKRLTNQLDVVKYLASKTGTPHGMLGTYDLLQLRNLTGQISRRSSIDVHFRRYKNTDADVSDFEDAVFTFQEALPVVVSPDLSPYIDYLMEGSVGCVGNLKEWLNKALELALSKGGKTLTIDQIRKSAWSKAQLSKMYSETLEGEALLDADEGRYEALRSLMWPGGKANGDGKGSEAGKKKGQKGRRRPGTRDPSIDKIGAGRMPQAAS